MKKRIAYLDELRVFAILCIILLHIIGLFFYNAYGVNTFKYAFYILLSSFTRVGIPIFFMLTGILMLQKEEENYTSYLKTRVMRFALAYGFFSIIYYFYHVIIDHKSFSFFELIRQVTSYQTEYHLWFMPVIILIYIGIPFIRTLVKNMKREELKRLIIVIFILSNGLKGVEAITTVFGYSLMSNFILPNLLGYMNYLLVGYYLVTKDYKINKRLIILTILSILCLPPLTIFVSKTGVNDVFLNAISLFVIAPSIFIFLVFKNKKTSFPTIISNWIKNHSNKVFYVYLIHVLFLNIIQKYIPSLFKRTHIIKELLIILLLWIVITILSFGFAMIWVKLKEWYIQYKDKIKNVFIKLLSVGMIAFILLVLINLLLNKYHFIKINYLTVSLAIILWCGLFYFLNRYQSFLFRDKRYNRALLLLFVMIQILVGVCFMVKPTWDFGEVYKIAVTFAKSNHPIFGAPYLYMCDNNIMIAAFFDIIFKAFYTIGIKNHFIELGILINIIMIDISLFYTYLLIKKVYFKMSRPFLIFMLCSSPLLFYIPIFYSDTISLPFVIVPLYYAYRYMYERQKKKYIILSGLFLGVGALFKPTVLIIGIALMIFLYLKKKKFNYYQGIPLLIGCMVLPLLGQKIFINHFFDKNDLELYRIPKNHYILIGLENNGEYSEDRFLKINSITGEQAKKEVVKKNIKNRIHEMIQKKEVLSFYNRKIAYTWTDGTFFSFEKLHRKPIHPELTKYVYSNEKKDILYWTISNSEWIMVLVLMMLGIIFKNYLPEKVKELGMIMNISIVGLFLFLLIWETRSRYLVNFIPIFMMNAYIGLYAFTNYLKRKKEGKKK